jgi:hypothetical protein
MQRERKAEAEGGREGEEKRKALSLQMRPAMYTAPLLQRSTNTLMTRTETTSHISPDPTSWWGSLLTLLKCDSPYLRLEIVAQQICGKEGCNISISTRSMNAKIEPASESL